MRCPEKYKWDPVTDLIYVQEEKCVYRFKDNIWEALNEEEELNKVIYNFLKTDKYAEVNPIPASVDVTNALVQSIVKELKLDLDFRACIPTTRSHHVCLTGSNEYLDTDNWQLQEAKRTDYAFFRLNLTKEQFENPVDPTQFLTFLKQIMVSKETSQTDYALIDFMQELMGYLLLDTTKAEATFFFKGDGSNGKSTLVTLIEKMVGASGTSGLSLDNLSSNRFATASLVGKRLNTVKEESSDRVHIDLFKSLVSGESIGAERKFGSSFIFTPRVKFIFATNKIPSFSNVDSALRRRLFLIPFNRKFKDYEKNVDLPIELAKEIPQIIRWAIEGAKRLHKRGYYFIRTSSMLEAQETFDGEQSSVIAFLDENFQKSDNMEDGFSFAEMYESYKEWCQLDSSKKAKTKSNFIADIRDREQEKERVPENLFYLKRAKKQVTGIRGYVITANQDSWVRRQSSNPRVMDLLTNKTV